MPSVVELKVQARSIWERMKEINDTAEARGDGLTAEEQANWDRANGELDSLNQRIARQEVLERTAASVEEQRRIPGREAATQQHIATPDEYREVFTRWVKYGNDDLDREEKRLLRSGQQVISAAEMRAIGVGNSAGAGYLVPPEYERTIMQNMLAFGGMREASTVFTTDSGADLPFPTSDDTGNTGELLAEHTQVGTQDVTVGEKILKSYTYSSKEVRVSLQLLQDSAFNIDTWLSDLLAERLARITNTHYTLGVGGNQPVGVLTSAGSGVAGATGQTTSVLWDDLISLEHSIDPAYRRNARYMFADSTLQYLRKIKDGEGRYIWQQGAAGTAPNTINGWPYTINQDMPALNTSNKSVLFGDFRNYKIRDVRGFTLIRLEELYAEYLQVAFFGFMRTDGLLVHAGTNPIKYYQNSAS